MSTTRTRAWSKHGPRAYRPDRRCGREAGKRRGYKIRTLTSDPQQRDDRRIAVWVVVTRSNLDDEDRIRERSELLIIETLNQRLG